VCYAYLVARTDFDKDYYRRFYNDDPVHTQSSIGALATAVHSLAQWWGIPIARVLDVGAGPGYWRDWYRIHHKTIEMTSVDVSEYACATYGHEQKDISQWRPRKKYDLIICHGVLHYLPNAAAKAAIDNIGHASRGLLYVEAPTTYDLSNVVDRDATDLEVFERSAKWYRKHLSVHFIQIGAGLWLHRSCQLPLYELEHLTTG
jgi:SAM-dependent methyltransferase